MSELKEGHLKKRGGSLPDKPGRNWNNRYFILSGSSLYYYENQADPIAKGLIQLRECTLEEIPEKEIKKSFCFILKTETQHFCFQAESETEYQEWVQVFRENLHSEPAPPPDRPKTKGFVFRAQQQMVEKAAITKVGKNLLKEYLPDDTWFLLESLKRMVSNSVSVEKAREIEHRILQIAIKTTLLYHGNHLTEENLLTCKIPVLKMWEQFIDCCDFEKKNSKK